MRSDSSLNVYILSKVQTSSWHLIGFRDDGRSIGLTVQYRGETLGYAECLFLR